MIEKHEFLSRRGKVVIALVVVAMIGAGIYWFNQSPALQETVNGFNPLQPQGNEGIQRSHSGNSGGWPVQQNQSALGTCTSQTGSGGNGTGNSEQNPNGSNSSGNGGSGGSASEDDGSGGSGNDEPAIQGTCSDSEGRICVEGQTCDGSILSTFDTDQCCFGKCV